MSIENHPNFHAVRFVTETTTAYIDSLRGVFKNIGDVPEETREQIQNLIVQVTDEIEIMLDNAADELEPEQMTLHLNE